MSKLVFIYGTLKKGCCRNHLLENQKFIGLARTTNQYKIYDCGGFPGLASAYPSEDNFVEGELWEVDENYISYLDRIEGSPYLYCLDKVFLQDIDEEVYAYFWKKSTVGLKDCGHVWIESF